MLNLNPFFAKALEVNKSEISRRFANLKNKFPGPKLPIGASFGFYNTRACWWEEGNRRALRINVGLEPLDEIPVVVESIVCFLNRLALAAGF